LPAGAGRRRGLVQPGLPAAGDPRRQLGQCAGTDARGVAAVAGFGCDLGTHRFPLGTRYLTLPAQRGELPSPRRTGPQWNSRMRQDPFGSQGNGRQRRGGGLFGNIRWVVLLGFAIYGGCYYLGNRTVDPYTGEKVLIDSSLDA